MNTGMTGQQVAAAPSMQNHAIGLPAARARR
jgi:hypothetical protein